MNLYKVMVNIVGGFMTVYYSICLFILGTILGSFFNVVGWRLPNGQSIVSPPSHCPKCNHQLKFWELIPVLSFFLQKGKCTSCNQKISWFYPFFEAGCGLLFTLAYLVYGWTLELVIVLTFISMLIIIMVSDYHYMIIPDEVLIFFGATLCVEIIFIYGWESLFASLVDGCIAMAAIFTLKLFGDLIFKRESMGGGDIKLLFVFGLVLGWPLAVFSILLGSIVGLPISLIILLKKKDHVIPFGPFLSVGAIILMLPKFDFNSLINILIK